MSPCLSFWISPYMDPSWWHQTQADWRECPQSAFSIEGWKNLIYTGASSQNRKDDINLISLSSDTFLCWIDHHSWFPHYLLCFVPFFSLLLLSSPFQTRPPTDIWAFYFSPLFTFFFKCFVAFPRTFTYFLRFFNLTGLFFTSCLSGPVALVM